MNEINLFGDDRRVTRDGVFNGRPVRYHGEIAATPVSIVSDDDVASGSVVSTAYLAVSIDGVAVDARRRPVVFVFNGGPITSSIYLHMLAFGPKRLHVPVDLDADPASFEVVDNPYTVLDVADIVCYDPIGTGYSTTGEATPADRWFSVESDAAQLREFVRAWLVRHDRLDSPVFLFGESYGTVRAAVAARQLTEGDASIRLDGVFLMGQALNIVETVQRRENVISYVVSLPTLAALGRYHGVAKPDDTPLPAFLESVMAYAETTYLNALVKGQQIPQAELQQVAQRLSELTGLPAPVFVENRLRVGKVPYRQWLFKDAGKVLGGNDGRYLGDAAPDGTPVDPSSVITPAVEAAHRACLGALFALPAEAGYRTRSPVTSLDAWRWGATSPFGDWRYGASIADAMHARPALRLVVGVGYHDTLTTWGATRYAIRQSDWPLDRVTFRGYFGGHLAYTVESSLAAMMQDVREWICTR
ncbi:hypothetical protein [Paraburkholderia sp.]|uniref:S10 family serine carboxypeptidase-like protein n=1 Tax=Paraburkholderia sp. TaxID=1926495 RepID=UPI002387EF06|nr:hypothetical protein [Paraburkholderia sp.]MDE1181877.1 hypothetical protein [Paraburkholderia sp.]